LENRLRSLYPGFPVYWWPELNHEPRVWNTVLKMTKATFVHFLHCDVEIVHQEYLETMLNYISRHPEVGLIRPNREGEPRKPLASPFPKWFDGIAGVIRLETEVLCDEDFIFTQWFDLDLGYEIEWRGYRVLVDPRVSVFHPPRDYSKKPPFYHAYSARNKLLLDMKWHEIGRKKWYGLGIYNKKAPPERRIPTVYELAAMTTEELKRFTSSVNMELAEIVGKNPNEGWVNPVVKYGR